MAFVGLCVYTISIVTFRIDAAVIGMTIGAIGLASRIQSFRLPRFVLLYAAFLGWAFVGSLFSDYGDITRDQIIERLKLLVVMIVAVNALTTDRQVRIYLLLFLACFVLFPIRGTIVGGDTIYGRAVWNYIYKNPNDLAALCLTALGVTLAVLFSPIPSPRARILVRVCAFISVALIVGVILRTQSRGAFIGLIIGFAPALLTQRRKRLSILIGVAAVVLVAGTMLPEAGFQRLLGISKLSSVSTIREADPEGSAEQRFEINQVAAKIALDHPMFGVGLGAYAWANAQYAPRLGRKDTHNTYLNVAAETGLPGLALWVMLFGRVLFEAHRARRRAKADSLARSQYWVEKGLIAYLVAGLFGSYAGLSFPYLMLALLWCMSTLLQRRHPASDASSSGAKA